MVALILKSIYKGSLHFWGGCDAISFHILKHPAVVDSKIPTNLVCDIDHIVHRYTGHIFDIAFSRAKCDYDLLLTIKHIVSGIVFISATSARVHERTTKIQPRQPLFISENKFMEIVKISREEFRIPATYK